MKKKFKSIVLFTIFVMNAFFVPNIGVNAEEINDSFGLHGKELAIVTKGTFVANNSATGATDESYLSLTDSYNDEYHANDLSLYNPNRIGGKKIVLDDLKYNQTSNTYYVTDDGVTFWHFELATNMEVADEVQGSKSSSVNGYFKWYYIYTVDEVGNKKYLNLNFGGTTNKNTVEISDVAEPVAVTKVNDDGNPGTEYALWGHYTRSSYIDDPEKALNILIPVMEVDDKKLGYNFGLFTGATKFKKGDVTRMFVLAEKQIDEKEVTSIPNVISGSNEFKSKITMYDYNYLINHTGAGLNGFKFYNGNSFNEALQVSKDGYGVSYSQTNVGSVTDFTIDKKLDENGYPTTSLGSLDYLFNNEKVSGKTVVGTATNSGGLFQKDSTGHYYYDSTVNAAYFNGSTFTLYDSVVRPSYTEVASEEYNLDERKGNFLPFNNISKNTISAYDVDATTSGVKAYRFNGVDDGIADLWFGMLMEASFLMPEDGLVNGEDMVFEVTGDDIQLVYIDGVLVLTNDGVSRYTTINFKTGQVSALDSDDEVVTIAKLFYNADVVHNPDGKPYIIGNTLNPDIEHDIKFFYIERGGNLSTFKFKFNLLQHVDVEPTPDTSDEVVNPSTSDSIVSKVVVPLVVVSVILLISGVKYLNLRKDNKIN